MEIQDLRAEVAGWARNKRGQLKLNAEHKSIIESYFQASRLNVQQFAEASGLSGSTVARIVKSDSKKLRPSKQRASNVFQSVMITRGPVFPVSGPCGMKVQCESLDQVAQLWRALC